VSGMPKETLPGIVTRSAGYNRIFSTTTGRLGQKRTPDSFRNLRFITLAMSYSRTTYRSTTIGAAAFHFRVRNGNGWDHCATITRRLVKSKLARGGMGGGLASTSPEILTTKMYGNV